ncbi:MAG: hypothetical protein LBS19_01005 [Clostridiales bacterium]|jgi:hypothetical protein|nr:hypothetical protein [Clostridiales bacterium]
MVNHRPDSIRSQILREKGIEPPADWNDLAQVKAAKKREIGADCSAAIYAGVTVGDKHYSLTDHDQTELMAQLSTVKEGAAAVPYHADGELCRLYPASEFLALAAAAMSHIFYHRTYCNHLNAWIKRATVKQLDGIAYGAQLPKDLQESMDALIAAAAPREGGETGE